MFLKVRYKTRYKPGGLGYNHMSLWVIYVGYKPKLHFGVITKGAPCMEKMVCSTGVKAGYSLKYDKKIPILSNQTPKAKPFTEP
jgi:hypothetical protein